MQELGGVGDDARKRLIGRHLRGAYGNVHTFTFTDKPDSKKAYERVLV